MKRERSRRPVLASRALHVPIHDGHEPLLADEVFMTGTAAEVTPVRSVDGVAIGVGPVTRAVRDAYLATVGGLDEPWGMWLHPVA